jgi:hypothetical protein
LTACGYTEVPDSCHLEALRGLFVQVLRLGLAS